LPFANDEFLIVDLKASNGPLAGNVLSAQPMLGERKAEGKIEGDAVTLDFPGKGIAISFRGKVGPDGKAFGLLNYGPAKYPARLEKTDAEKVATLSSAAGRTKLNDATREADPKVKVTKLLALSRTTPAPTLRSWELPTRPACPRRTSASTLKTGPTTPSPTGRNGWLISGAGQ
jgi:hypothetical protein